MQDIIEKIENHIESSTDEAEREEMMLKGESICYYGTMIQAKI